MSLTKKLKIKSCFHFKANRHFLRRGEEKYSGEAELNCTVAKTLENCIAHAHPKTLILWVLGILETILSHSIGRAILRNTMLFEMKDQHI